MTDDLARALLAEALQLFNDAPRFSLRRNRKRTRYALAARIEAFLDTDEALHPSIAIARDRWADADFVHIDRDERGWRGDEQDVWVRAWLRVDAASLGTVAAETGARYRTALAELPENIAATFTAHRRDGESIASIAGRCGITTAQVEHHIAEALATLAHALGRR